MFEHRSEVETKLEINNASIHFKIAALCPLTVSKVRQSIVRVNLNGNRHVIRACKITHQVHT